MGPRVRKAIIKLQRSIDDLVGWTKLQPTLWLKMIWIHEYSQLHWCRGDQSSGHLKYEEEFAEKPKAQIRFQWQDLSGKQPRYWGEATSYHTKTQEADDLVALRPFSQTQRLLFQKCQGLVQAKAQELLGTSQKIELVESVLMSKDNSHIQQELHPDLDNTYVSKAPRLHKPWRPYYSVNLPKVTQSTGSGSPS